MEVLYSSVAGHGGQALLAEGGAGVMCGLQASFSALVACEVSCFAMRRRHVLLQECHSSTLEFNYPTMRRRQEEKENIRKYMEMVAQREAKAEEERLRKKVAADAAFKAVVEQTEKQNNEEDELRMLRWVIQQCCVLHLKQGWRYLTPGEVWYTWYMV